MKEYDKALKEINISLKMNPNYVVALDSRSHVYRKTGRYKEAMEDINRAISIDPYYWNAYYTRGLNYRAMGETEKAFADFEKACDARVYRACVELMR